MCRNPDGNNEIWCYTTDKAKRWEGCAPLTPPTCAQPPPTTLDLGDDINGVPFTDPFISGYLHAKMNPKITGEKQWMPWANDLEDWGDIQNKMADTRIPY